MSSSTGAVLSLVRNRSVLLAVREAIGEVTSLETSTCMFPSHVSGPKSSPIRALKLADRPKSGTLQILCKHEDFDYDVDNLVFRFYSF